MSPNGQFGDLRNGGTRAQAALLARSGKTIALGTQGHLTITPPGVPFGYLVVGTTSAPQTVTLGNDGGASLDIVALDMAAAPFASSGGTCASTLPFAIAADASCTLTYVFAPTAAGDSNQTLAVATNLPSDGSIALSGGAYMSADQSVTIMDHTDYVVIGDTHDYIAVVSNAGPHTGRSMVTVGDTAKAVAGGAWTCVPTGGATCSGGVSDHVLMDTVELPAGSSVTYVYTVVIPPTDETQIKMEAFLTVLAPYDPNMFDDLAFDTDTVAIFRDGFDDESID